MRRIAQFAAAIGRTFSADLLDEVVGADEARKTVAALLQAKIVEVANGTTTQTWRFTHALLRDAALSTLARSERREIFGQIARTYESLSGSHRHRLEMLAYYYARSDDSRKAIEYRELAAERALRLGAIAEATEQLEGAERLAVTTHDSHATTRVAARLATLRQV